MKNKALYAIRYGNNLIVMDYTGLNYSFRKYNISRSGYIDFYGYEIKTFKRLGNACNYLESFKNILHSINYQTFSPFNNVYCFYMDHKTLFEKLHSLASNSLVKSIHASNCDIKLKVV